MCGRYYLNFDNLLMENFDSNNTISYETNFNITPQTKVPVLIESKLTMATWGFFPDWIKSQKNSKPLFNTRWETIQEKRTFQTAFKKHRCLVPISGWYEWKNVNDEKQPYFFHKENKLLQAAGLYWLRSSGDIEFSIITNEAEDDLLTIHNRTPLILNKESQNVWISDIEIDTLYQDISVQKKLDINFHRVSKSVNNPKNTNSSLIKEYTEVPF
ncbi:SOS response-associated peptidase [Candidatus Actinomarina]|nr:SOS response-associated peptidase [Candidatus Actinomarina sp.]